MVMVTMREGGGHLGPGIQSLLFSTCQVKVMSSLTLRLLICKMGVNETWHKIFQVATRMRKTGRSIL